MDMMAMARRRGGGIYPDAIGTPPWRGKLAATPANADLKVGATISLRLHRARAEGRDAKIEIRKA